MTDQELARRICGAHHPAYATTGQVTPCAEHIQEARRLYALTTPAGDITMRVLVAARNEVTFKQVLPDDG